MSADHFIYLDIVSVVIVFLHWFCFATIEPNHSYCSLGCMALLSTDPNAVTRNAGESEPELVESPRESDPIQFLIVFLWTHGTP